LFNLPAENDRVIRIPWTYMSDNLPGRYQICQKNYGISTKDQTAKEVTARLMNMGHMKTPTAGSNPD